MSNATLLSRDGTLPHAAMARMLNSGAPLASQVQSIDDTALDDLPRVMLPVAETLLSFALRIPREQEAQQVCTAARALVQDVSAETLLGAGATILSLIGRPGLAVGLSGKSFDDLLRLAAAALSRRLGDRPRAGSDPLDYAGAADIVARQLHAYARTGDPREVFAAIDLQDVSAPTLVETRGARDGGAAVPVGLPGGRVQIHVVDILEDGERQVEARVHFGSEPCQVLIIEPTMMAMTLALRGLERVYIQDIA